MTDRVWRGGAKIMNELYEELGLSIPEGYADAWEYHNRPDSDNLAHNFNRESSSRRWNVDQGRKYLQENLAPEIETNRAANFYQDYNLGTESRIIRTPEGEHPTRMVQSLDIEDAATSELLGERGDLWGLDAEEAQAVETAFIDMVWGTDGGLASTLEGGERIWDDPESGFDATWGLDLRRVYDEDALNLTSSEMAAYLAEGPIDWQSYADDPLYQAAFEESGIDITDDSLSEAYRAGEVRRITYNQEGSTSTRGNPVFSILFGQDEGEFPEPDVSDAYDYDRVQTAYGDLYIDGERQPTVLETLEANRYNPENGWEGQLQRDPYEEKDINDLRSREYRRTNLDLPSRSDFGLSINPSRTEVRRPANIPASWGSTEV